ncbi:MAG: pyruvate kinase [Candidatus Magasanikbacteria bacterium]|jgi:pyruvate kinase
MHKHTKIVATIGPACEDKEILKQMVQAGMNCARLNFSHGSYDEFKKIYNNIRELETELVEPIIILQDLQGPKIRIGEMPAAGIEIKDDKEVVFNTKLTKYVDGEIPFPHPELYNFLKPGERLLIDDGRCETKIEKLSGGKIFAKVVEGRLLTSHKGVNLPDSNISLSSLTKKDKEDLMFGLKLGVDMVAISFVNRAEDVIDARFLIKEYEEKLGLKPEHPIQIISKIERPQAVENIESILAASDGVMVARGDLGVEIRAAEVPLVQKRIIEAANKIAKPVIVATQMLDSMSSSRRPTRAEVSDVANAVIDHADAVMLSNETSTGSHPVLVIETMADIIATTEKSHYDDLVMPVLKEGNNNSEMAITYLSRVLAEDVKAKAILVASISGDTGRLISSVRPNAHIVVATTSERVQRQLNLSWGVRPFILHPCRSIEELVENSISYIKKRHLVKTGEKVIVVAGEPVGEAGKINLLEVREVK